MLLEEEEEEEVVIISGSIPLCFMIAIRIFLATSVSRGSLARRRISLSEYLHHITPYTNNNTGRKE
jgi:hypothetical protein